MSCVKIFLMKIEADLYQSSNNFAVSHEFLDVYQLECAKRIAEILLISPGLVINKAEENLNRWLSSAAFESGEVKALNEWREILQKSTPQEIARLLTEDSNKGQRLRQSSPFVGILSKKESRQIREKCEKAAAY